MGATTEVSTWEKKKRAARKRRYIFLNLFHISEKHSQDIADAAFFGMGGEPVPETAPRSVPRRRYLKAR